MPLGWRLLAGWTQPLDLELVAQDAVVHGAAGLLLQPQVDRHRQVVDAAAADATDVVVPPGVAVEAGGMAAAVDLADQACARELLQVPVHGAEADPRQPPPGLPEDPFGGRVLHRRADHRQHHVALAALPQLHQVRIVLDNPDAVNPLQCRAWPAWSRSSPT